MRENKLFSKIIQWLFYGFTYGFVSCKMNNTSNVFVFLEYGAGFVKILEGLLYSSLFLPVILSIPSKKEGRRARVIIYRNNIKAIFY